MDIRKKFWLVLIGSILGMAVIACSCNSLVPTATAQPATLPPAQPPAQTSGATLAGNWLDPDTTGTITTIVAQSSGFAVQSVINPDRGGNELTKTSWSNGVLTWTYCIPGGNCITSITTNLQGDSLYTTWSDDRGYAGTTVFQRQP